MILVVDDHNESREALIRLLHADGYETIGARDGNQALLFLHSPKPRLILLDCHMPFLDGFGVLRAVRADAAYADIPVFMLSADPASEATALQLGAQGFMLKGSLDWVK